MIKKQFLRFIVVGLLSTIVNYGLFYALYSALGFPYLFAMGLGFVAGVFAGYALNKGWTFEVTEKSKTHIIKYYSVYTTSLILGLIFLRTLVEWVGFIPEIAAFLTIGLTTCTNFIGTKIWVFKK